MLGSHNSITSCPHPWWQFVFCPFSKCQSKSLEEQYLSGVRYFDFRLKVYPSGYYFFSHGLMRYPGLDLMSVLSRLERLSVPEDPVYFRILLEYNRPPEDEGMIVSRFKDILRLSGVNGFRNCVFCGAYRKWDGYKSDFTESLYPVSAAETPAVLCKSSSALGKKRFLWCIPWLYARLHNRSIMKEHRDILDSSRHVLMLDFV